jgi:hypothetical protein
MLDRAERYLLPVIYAFALVVILLDLFVWRP